MSHADLKERCKAKAKWSGQRCRRRPMLGQLVCDIHGGKAPQALAKAEDRMRDLIHPAITSLRRQIDANEFQAARYVLDWAGFRAVPDESHADLPPISVTVSFDRVDEPHPVILSLPPDAQNGSAST
jgi:hypothetical protein